MGFLDLLTGFLNGTGGIGADAAVQFQFLYFYTTSLFLSLYGYINAVGNFLLTALRNLAKPLLYIWEHFFKNILNKIFLALLRAHDWLEQHLAPIIRFLQKVRQIIDRIFVRYVKPFLDLIQHIRRVLLVLRLFHVKFAEQLDRKLLRIETRVAAVFIEARAILNNVIDAVNIIIDPAKLLRHPVLVISIRRSLPAIFRAVTGMPIGYFFPSQLTEATAEERDPGGCGNVSVPFEPPLFPMPPPLIGFTGDSFLAADGTPADDAEVTTPPPLGYFDSATEAVSKCVSPDQVAPEILFREYQALNFLTGSFKEYAREVGEFFRFFRSLNV